MLPFNVPTDRRTVMQKVAGLTAGAILLVPAAAVEINLDKPQGKPGEFDFLAGEWKIKNKRLKENGKDWDEFEGEATCWSILKGLGSIEELRIPARNFSGMGLRLLDVEKKIWNDFWVNAKNCVLTTPGLTGHFENGIGTFIAEEEENGKKMLAKGVWDGITPRSCRWYQATSKDGGKTWEENWVMDWTRVK